MTIISPVNLRWPAEKKPRKRGFGARRVFVEKELRDWCVTMLGSGYDLTVELGDADTPTMINLNLCDSQDHIAAKLRWHGVEV